MRKFLLTLVAAICCATIFATEGVHQLDSVISENYDGGKGKLVYSYDARGNKSSTITYKWDAPTSAWKALYKTTFSYNEMDSLVQRIEYKWDENIEKWCSSSQTEYEYNDMGQKISYTHTGSSTTEREEYNYDSKGNIINVISYFNSEINRKDEYSYINGQLVELLRSYWHSGYQSWELHSKYEWTRNSEGAILTEVFYYWKDNISDWKENNKIQNTYDAKGRLVNSISSTWEDNTWEKSSMQTFTYNEEGQLLTRIGQWWVNNQWVNAQKDENTYNEHGDISQYEELSWDDNEWKLLYRYIYFYASAHGLDQITNDQLPITNKVIVNGQLLIERNGKTYNALGTEVK